MDEPKRVTCIVLVADSLLSVFGITMEMFGGNGNRICRRIAMAGAARTAREFGLIISQWVLRRHIKCSIPLTVLCECMKNESLEYAFFFHCCLCLS